VFRHPIHPNDEKYRDLWVFSFYCNGANLSDVLNFKYKDIEGDYIQWYRSKTEHNKDKPAVRAFLTPEMKAIIEAYGNQPEPENYIFPYLRDGLKPEERRKILQNTIHSVNKKMTSIGKALKIGHITSYWARHSWASISRRAGVSTYGISKGLGHKNLSTTEIYLDSLSDEEIVENANKLPRR
jgi:integrase